MSYKSIVFSPVLETKSIYWLRAIRGGILEVLVDFSMDRCGYEKPALVNICLYFLEIKLQSSFLTFSTLLLYDPMRYFQRLDSHLNMVETLKTFSFIFYIFIA